MSSKLSLQQLRLVNIAYRCAYAHFLQKVVGQFVESCRQCLVLLFIHHFIQYRLYLFKYSVVMLSPCSA